MFLDIVTIGVILAFFIRGYLKGFIVALFSVVAILLGILCALFLSHTFAEWMYVKGYVGSGWSLAVSYIVLFVGIVLLVRLLAKIVEKAAEGLMLGLVNRLAGGMLYAFLGAVLWSSLLLLATKLDIISKSTIDASRTYSSISKLAPWFFEQAGKLLPFAKHTFDKIDQFFSTVNHKPA